MPLCLTAGTVSVVLVANAFTLAWTHSIEKIRWEEDWQVVGERLQVVAARIRGSGAGMEPPAGAVLQEGVWHYRPAMPAQETLLLTRSPFAADHELCDGAHCRPLGDLLPGLDEFAVVKIAPCGGSTATAGDDR
jgi:hypothetical protein